MNNYSSSTSSTSSYTGIIDTIMASVTTSTSTPVSISMDISGSILTFMSTSVLTSFSTAQSTTQLTVTPPTSFSTNSSSFSSTSTSTTTTLTTATTLTPYVPLTTVTSPINPEHVSWVLIPGVGYYYGGAGRRKSFVSTLASSALSISIVSLQFFLWGYSLAFSETSKSSFIGNLDNIALINVGNEPNQVSPTIPANAFITFQSFLASLSASLSFGSVSERATLHSFSIFIFVWSTLVYDFITYWTRSANGWLRKLGVLDFSGGTPVHITSGFSALAYSLCVGPRRTVDFKNMRDKAVNPSEKYLGTALIWFGWLGYNSGSEPGANSRAANAAMLTNLAASSGGITWIVIDMIWRRSKRLSMTSFCSGSMAGLVAITPASGYVALYFAPIFGITASVMCFLATKLKKLVKYRYDDPNDVWALNGVGGIVGNILTGLFAQNAVVTMAGDEPLKNGAGFIDRNLISSGASSSWAFAVTFIITKLLGLVFNLRLNPLEEEIGSDLIETEEKAFDFNAPEMSKDILKELKSAWNVEKEPDFLSNFQCTSEEPQAVYDKGIDMIKKSTTSIIKSAFRSRHDSNQDADSSAIIINNSVKLDILNV